MTEPHACRAWQDAVRGALDEALTALGSATQNCPEDLWTTSMWRVLPTEMVGDVYEDHGSLITDPDEREARIQRWSHPWSVAWHALEVLDYDLAAELDTWTPPAPFAGHPHWRDFTRLAEGWSRTEIGSYVDYCRQRVSDVLGEMDEDRASTVLPSAHRYAGKPYAWLVTSLIGHTAHANQIKQFVDGAGR